MDYLRDELSAPHAWKNHFLVMGKFLGIFYITTLCLALFFIYRGENWIVPAILLAGLYCTILFFSVRQMLKKLPMAAIMLAAPTIPLFMLILVISLIGVLQIVYNYF